MPALSAIVLGASSHMHLELRLLFDSSARRRIHILSYGLNLEHFNSHQLAIAIGRSSPDRQVIDHTAHSNTSSNCIQRALHFWETTKVAHRSSIQ